MVFSGTTDKCKTCDKTVHFIDMITADGIPYHKTCFKCSHCNGKLVMGSYSSMDGVLYCKPHFEQLFKETGSFTKNFQTCNLFLRSIVIEVLCYIAIVSMFYLLIKPL
ncbi:LIM domain-containing protein PLIM2b [Linum perenne]